MAEKMEISDAEQISALEAFAQNARNHKLECEGYSRTIVSLRSQLQRLQGTDVSESI